MWLAKSFWRTILAAGVLLGLLYIPSDIEGLPDALRRPLGFLVTYKETLLIGYAICLTLWIAWRDARPFALLHIRAWFGWRANADLIRALDSQFVEGVKRRNRIRSDKPVNPDDEDAEFRKWNDAVIALLEPYSLREQSYFKTLDLFKAEGLSDTNVRLYSWPGRSHLEAMWNEKLKRLREIINRIEE